MLSSLKRFHYSKNYPQYVFYRAVISACHRLQISLDREQKVADIPCGHGEFTFNLARHSKLQVDASDINKSSIAHAKSYFQRENITYTVSDVNEALAQKQDHYDLIFVINSLFLLPQHELFLKNCHRSLKRGGKLFLVVPNTASDNFKRFQKLDPALNILVTSKDETVSYVSSFGFKSLLSEGLVYASFYKRKELKYLGPLSNFYLIALNKIYTLFNRQEPCYYLLVFEK